MTATEQFAERVVGAVDAAGLNERYVREWLGGMVAADIVDYDPGEATYSLPPERFDAELVDIVLPLVDGLPDRLRAGLDVADIGCGSGHAINVMAQAFPASTFTGIDFSDEGLAVGRDEAESLGLANATFVARDVAAFDMTDAFDVITAFDAIHDQAQPARLLENKYAVSTMHCMSVSLALDGAGLGSVWARQLAESMLADAGFGDVTVIERDTDPVNNYYIARKS